MSPVKSPPGESGSVSELVARYQMVVERARKSNVNADAVFEVLRMEAVEWREDQIDAAIILLKQRDTAS
ncbi:MAG: hypothetical protein JWQ22_1235 [Devosia sp.]|nr:hypothetical protein [Devosia sp.]